MLFRKAEKASGGSKKKPPLVLSLGMIARGQVAQMALVK
jgi:hypothetical protein